MSNVDPPLRARLDEALANALGLEDHEPAAPAPTRNRKLVVFVPTEALDTVRSALFAAGAGRIGDYERCSFYTEGTGTFFGAESAAPTVGERGREERVAEFRLETVYSSEHEREVVEALVVSHPYEEPAFDLYPLVNVDPDRQVGRVGTLAADPVERLEALGIEPVLRRRPNRGKRVAVFTGMPGPCTSDCVIAPIGDPDVLAPTLEAWALEHVGA